MVMGFIVIGIVVLLLALLVLLIVISATTSRKKRQELKQQNISSQSSLHHVEGLPLAEKTLCELSIGPEKLVIEGGGTDFSINISQIRAVEVKTDVEIAHIVHSSAGKGIAGGLLFGPIGLVVGARATSKEKKTNTYYLIINYTNSDGAMTALMFDGGNAPFNVQKIANKLKPLIINNPKQTVQL